MKIRASDLPQRLYEAVKSWCHRRCLEGVSPENIDFNQLPGHLKREIREFLRPEIIKDRKRKAADREREEKQLVEEILYAVGVRTSEHSFVSSRSKGQQPWDFDKQ